MESVTNQLFLIFYYFEGKLRFFVGVLRENLEKVKSSCFPAMPFFAVRQSIFAGLNNSLVNCEWSYRPYDASIG